MYKNFLPIYDKNKCILFALGRNAMYAACKALKLQAGDEVLTPAFDCDGSLQPFRVLDIKLRFFKSNPYNFHVDIDDIKNKISSKTKLLHIINHFGMPQPWDELISLRKETGIPILEDNAYSLFSKINGRLFGTFGDISIFSLRKNLPLADGGLLRLNNPNYEFRLLNNKAPLFYLVDLSNWLKIIKDKLGINKIPPSFKKLIKRFSPNIMPPPPLYSGSKNSYPEWPLRDVIGKEFSRDYLRPMSRFSRKILGRFSHIDYAEIIKKKRQYYHWLSNRLKQIPGIKILWPDLPEGIAPFCFSLLVPSDKRDAVLEKLQKKYNVMAWPILSKLVLDQLEDFPDVQLLGRKLLQFNLPSEKVCLPRFSRYIENLTNDVCQLLT